MKTIFFLFSFIFLSNFGFSQLVINELDCDNAGADNKEFVELKSNVPFFALDGYVLVFFNGASTGGQKSYMVFDLDNATTDINGLFTIGNNAVSPLPNNFMNDSVIQNGPDGLGLYLGNASNFPTNTVATTTNLIDAVVYDTGSAAATGLLSALGLTQQWDENLNNNSINESIQRKNDGTFETKLPTPGAHNDGSGIVLNGVSATVFPSGNLTEGNSFNIIFQTQTPVLSDLSFTFSLTNGSFDSLDYSSDLSVLIPAGASNSTKTILLNDDTINEGDENMIVSMSAIPAAYTKLNDNIVVRIIDNDFLSQTWGSPINPTFGLVSSTKPLGYYDSLEGKSGTDLKQAIQDIIANPVFVRKHTYGDAYDILKEADQNPANSSQVWLMYVEQGRSKLDIQIGSSGTGFWNREHIYPQSRGGFTNATSTNAYGINNWTSTDANDIACGHSDAHHIRAEDSPENSSRNNRNYGVDYNGPQNSQGSWHGDVARSLFYMATRYNGLGVVNGNPSETPVGSIGDLTTLLQWNTADPADDYEMNRNNIIYNWQKNRNPFIDFPNLADYIWGVNAGQTWFSNLDVNDVSISKILIFPNPAIDQISISGVENFAKIEITNLFGQRLFASNFKGFTTFKTYLASGIYFVIVESTTEKVVQKLIIK